MILGSKEEVNKSESNFPGLTLTNASLVIFVFGCRNSKFKVKYLLCF